MSVSSETDRPPHLATATGAVRLRLRLQTGSGGSAIIDRLTFGGNLIQTGTESYRLAHTRSQMVPA